MLNKIISTLPPLESHEDERHQGRIEGIKAALSYRVSTAPVFLALFLTAYLHTLHDPLLSIISLFGIILSITKFYYESTTF